MTHEQRTAWEASQLLLEHAFGEVAVIANDDGRDDGLFALGVHDPDHERPKLYLVKDAA